MAFLITNIKQLIGVRDENKLLRGADLSELPLIDNAYLVLDGERIAGFGKMEDLKDDPEYYNDTYDAGGGTILPTWCDSHTHLVFAASRENEFVEKLKGASYAEIAAKGGGILNSAAKIHATSEDELFEMASERLKNLMRLGTGAIEIKSGYGLTLDGELKMLRVIKRLKEKSPIPVKSTFLGAHTFPTEFKDDKQAYVDLVIKEMLPVIAKEGLADYIDAFCEEGFLLHSKQKKYVKLDGNTG
jgi:imidazolonepropionase